jgi:hypothetical protein
MNLEFEPKSSAASPPIGTVINCRDDLVEVLRARKAELNLSNAYIEDQLHMAAGGADKVIGPSRTRGLSLPVALDLIELLGGRLVFEVDAETETRMRERWERRDSRKVHPPKRRVSKAGLARAAPLLFSALGKAGGAARAKSLTAKQRKEIARTAALSRWRLYRAAVKARVIAEASA